MQNLKTKYIPEKQKHTLEAYFRNIARSLLCLAIVLGKNQSQTNVPNMSIQNSL